jgi:hypothetical protein
MIRRLKWILIAAKAWGWRRKGRWALAMLLVLAAGMWPRNRLAFAGICFELISKLRCPVVVYSVSGQPAWEGKTDGVSGVDG